jgi:HEAT repeat protein
MSPLTVFIRTLLKSSAICFGIAIAVVQPTMRPQRAIAQKSPSQAATDALIAALKDSDAGVRAHAATALGSLGSAAAVPALTAAVADESPEVRLRALAALGELEDTRGAAAAIAALKDPDTGVRRAALYVLAEIGSGGAAR